MTRAELNAALEAAEGPNRLLDEDIDDFALAAGQRQERLCQMAAPHYTSSLDAAMMLYKVIPERVPSNPVAACAEALKQWS